MANRILVATLYQTIGENDTVFFLNLGPDEMSVRPGDDIYLIVQQGNVPFQGHTFTYDLSFSGDGPITDPPSSDDGAFNTPILLGKAADKPGNTYSYTITVTYASQEYSEDPRLKIKHP